MNCFHFYLTTTTHNAPDVQVARVGARAYGGGAKGAEKAAYLKAIAHGVDNREMAL